MPPLEPNLKLEKVKRVKQRWSCRDNKAQVVRLKKMRVCLDQNFMARVWEKLIRHSKEMVLRKRVAEQQETISLLVDALDLLLEQ